MPKPIALACSDIHLTDRAPVCHDKSAWWDAQEYMLKQINQIAAKHNVKILFAGDCFDRSKMPPKVEILAMQYMHGWIMIPGQHDLPHHNMELKGESSYGVLEEYNSLEMEHVPGAEICYFPWGAELMPYDELVEATCGKAPDHEDFSDIKIALVHAMVWEGEPPYPGAPATGNVKSIASVMSGYDFIVCGDNHKGFVTKIGNTTIVNCGSTMRRNVSQINYKPMVHLLFDDKTVESIHLDTSKDVISAAHKERKEEKDNRIDAFVSTLSDVEISLSFQNNMHRYMEQNEITGPVKEVILEEMV